MISALALFGWTCVTPVQYVFAQPSSNFEPGCLSRFADKVDAFLGVASNSTQRGDNSSKPSGEEQPHIIIGDGGVNLSSGASFSPSAPPLPDQTQHQPPSYHRICHLSVIIPNSDHNSGYSCPATPIQITVCPGTSSEEQRSLLYLQERPSENMVQQSSSVYQPLPPPYSPY